MPKYVIERNIPNVGSWTDDQFRDVSKTSCNVLSELGPEIEWLHSYVTGDRIYCIYNAPNEEMIREHATRGGFPADNIAEVRSIIDPSTAGN